MLTDARGVSLGLSDFLILPCLPFFGVFGSFFIFLDLGFFASFFKVVSSYFFDGILFPGYCINLASVLSYED